MPNPFYLLPVDRLILLVNTCLPRQNFFTVAIVLTILTLESSASPIYTTINFTHYNYLNNNNNNNNNNDKDIRANAYVESHKIYAIQEMIWYGIPASITLAQALIETDFGRSRLMTEGNNHFGIKCKSYWQGDTIQLTDDSPNECFRKYNSVAESYTDHSEFLFNHPKGYYTSLFELPANNYKEWAIGLKKAGYATNPNYDKILISLISRYELAKYDAYNEETLAQLQNQQYINDNNTQFIAILPAPTAQGNNQQSQPNQIYQQPTTTTAQRQNSNQLINKSSFAANAEQQPSQKPIRLVWFERQINNCLVTQCNAAVSPNEVAKKYHLTVAQIYIYNNLSAGNQFTTGTPIFLEPKRNKTKRNYKYYHAAPNETLWDVSQHYGVDLIKLAERNYMPTGYKLTEGEKVYLRGKNKSRKNNKTTKANKKPPVLQY